ncbi:dihydroorotate dehydrogenase (fumarate) [Balneicella halophila]|uniref:Dihydroorotate dehydrogenase (Fumarate) n=1 Tax=Balneicella halophila TaxID=1537566 RepID=A0A7L4USI2_BALHA|nr:dihydroorotate dehydrogenase-like protein [Balneicella halophila]PVX52187.1 dihydroorotate dehydrogenase (fumarate) [Balneicella halophila]
MANLETQYAGLKLKNPIIASSSGVTDSLPRVKKLAEAGVGAVVLKSIFEEEILIEMEELMQKMTARPFVYPETLDYMEEDQHEDIIRTYLSLISECKKAVDIPIIASINAVSNQKWTYLASEIEKAGADAIELNMFALPSDINKTSQEIEDTYISIVKQVISEVKNIPVTVKISHYFTAMGHMIQRFSEAGAKGIVVFNRYYSGDINIHDETLDSAFVLSHNNEIALPMRWVGLMSDKIDADMAATTGIHTGEDVVKLLLAGAPLVQIATALYKNNFTVVGEMLEFIEKWMKEKEYKSIEDFRGKLNHKGEGDTASWERVQFMKEFRHFVLKHMQTPA